MSAFADACCDPPRLRRRRLPDDTDLLALARRHPRRYPFLLETTSSAGGSAGHDLLFAFPGERLELRQDGGVFLDDRPLDTDFFTALDHCWEKASVATREAGAVFQGGWFLYLSYELAGHIEPRLELRPADAVLPVATAVRFHTVLQRDRATGEICVISEATHAAEQAAVCEDVARLPVNDSSAPAAPRPVLHEAEPRDYLHAVARIKDWIRAGDVFQVNLSRPWRGHGVQLSDEELAALYARLREANPAPFAGLARWPEAAVLSSSPERLVRVRAGMVETRPIAGTRPRRAGADETDRRALVAHPKERAEHIMLIDLERNDLGRICVPGSIAVDELMVTESYAHVHHIVSNVRGRLRDDVLPGEVIRAVFPGGTITGCPKVRCMEIIAALEGEARGPYTGSLGYLNRNGDMDLNILIRTISLCGDTLAIRAGAGIVADSDPARELEETRAKAEGMLRALRPA